MRLRTPLPPPDLARPPSPPPVLPADLKAARRRVVWQRRLRRGAALAAAVLVLGGATWLVGYSDVLSLRTVDVRGADEAVTAAVLEAAAAPVGVPLARVDTVALAERAQQVPEVASVSVTRGWPHTLRVQVTPRTPVAVLKAGEQWRLVDAEGTLFGAPAGPDGSLPTVVAPDTESGAQARVAAVRVAGSLPADLLASVERIEAGSTVDVRLVLRDGRTVTWGSPDQAERKAQVLALLLATPAAGYDVSVPDRPTVRPAP
jgi:cell division protein FtsQ